MKKSILQFLVVLIAAAGCQKDDQADSMLRFFGDALEDIGYSVAIASDGYIIAGQYNRINHAAGTTVPGLSDKQMVVIKTDWDGNLRWKVTAGGKYDDRGRKIYQLSDGSMICVGTTTDTVNTLQNGTDVFLVRISSDGEKIWEKALGGADNQTGIDIIESEGGFLILGTTDTERPQSPAGEAGNYKGKLDFYFLRTDLQGEYIDHNQYGFWEDEIPSAISYEPGGNFIILGSTTETIGTVPPVTFRMNLILFRLKSNLSNLEPLIIRHTRDIMASDLVVRPNGYMVSATSGKESETQEAVITFIGRSFTGVTPVTLVPFTIQGRSTVIRSMSVYGKGNYVFAGSSGTGNSADMLVFETDSTGVPVSGHVVINGSTGKQSANDVASGDDGYIIAVGSNSYELNSLISLFKFRFP